MNIIHETKLKPDKEADIRSLMKICTDTSYTGLSYPYHDDDSVHFLYYTDNTLLGVLALCHISQSDYECIAFTHPEYRHTGICSSIWKEAVSYLTKTHKGKHVEISFISDNLCDDVADIMEHIGAKVSDVELQMSGLLTDDTSLSDEELSVSDEVEYQVIPGQNDKTIYLYGFFVEPSSRSQGTGTKAFHQICTKLYREGYRVINLQVNEDNLPALHIYKNSGLSTGVKLTYYKLVI